MNLKKDDLVKLIPQEGEPEDFTVYRIVEFFDIPLETENKKGAIIEKAYGHESQNFIVLTERLRRHL